MRITGRRTWLSAMALLMTTAACADDGDDGRDSDSRQGESAVIDPGDGGNYSPSIDPAMFTSEIDNPYMPLVPGSRWVFEETDPSGAVEIITVEVTADQRTVMGVETVVVHDTVTIDGQTIEDTYDWYAQDAEGNVWYFGEATTAYDEGQASTAGSWEAGVGGALPGIAMPAHPQVSGTGYREEYLRGEAEDMAEVIHIGEHLDQAGGSWDDVIVTRNWTPLEPDIIETKYYAPGVGLVRETKTGDSVTMLLEYTPGSAR